MSRLPRTNTKQKRNSTKTVKPNHRAKQAHTEPVDIDLSTEDTYGTVVSKPPVKGRRAQSRTTLSPARESAEPPKEKRHYQPKWVNRWLAALEQTGINTAACKAAGISPSTPHHYLENHPEFKEMWDNAQRIADEALLKEARRRAVEGVQRPIYQKGLLVGYENVYSDNVLLALLKSRFPDDFADRVVIKVEPSWFEILRRHGLTPTDAFKLMITELEKVDAPNDSDPLPEPIVIGAKRILP